MLRYILLFSSSGFSMRYVVLLDVSLVNIFSARYLASRCFISLESAIIFSISSEDLVLNCLEDRLLLKLVSLT